MQYGNLDWSDGNVGITQLWVKNIFLLSSPEVDIHEISIGPAVFCGVGLSLGLLGVAAGTFFFVKGNQYQGIPVPSD